MKPERLILELEEIIERLGYSIRKEKGNFRGGNCVVEGEKLIMLNKNHPPEYQVGMLARFLEDHPDLDSVFIKPNIRRELETIWLQKPKDVKRRNPLFEDGGFA